MAVFVQDTFTGTDATTLQSHTPDTGTQWEACSISADGSAKTTNAEINTNRVRSGTTNTPSRVYRSPDDPGTNEYDIVATITMGTAGSGDVPALMARLDPTGTTSLTFYAIRYLGAASAGNRRWQLYKVVDDVGDFTIASDFNEDLAGTTVTVKFEVRDAAKKLFVDYGAGYVERISTADDTITQNGRVGLVCASHRSNVNFIDNFSAETVSSDQTVEPTALGGSSLHAPAVHQQLSTAALGPATLSSPQVNMAVELAALGIATLLSPSVQNGLTVEPTALGGASIFDPQVNLSVELTALGGATLISPQANMATEMTLLEAGDLFSPTVAQTVHLEALGGATLNTPQVNQTVHLVALGGAVVYDHEVTGGSGVMARRSRIYQEFLPTRKES